MAGDVAAAGKVVGALGEAGGHSVRSLQNAHRRLCDRQFRRGGVGVERKNGGKGV